MSDQYTNKELAHDYLLVAGTRASTAEDYTRYIGQQLILLQTKVNIQEFFNEKCGLEGLVIKGLSNETRRVLSLILDYGVDKTLELYMNNIDRAELDEPVHFHLMDIGKRKKGAHIELTDSSWENAVALLEG